MDLTQVIPLVQPYLGTRAKMYVDECFDSHWVSSRGHFIPDFESAFADFAQTKYAVAVSNGTTALHLALVALGIGEGDEVIVPDLTFAATINAVIHAGATPVIVDVDRETWNISPQRVADAVTSRTRAVIPVHLYGYPCDMDALQSIANRHGLFLIEDAAEAHGATIGGRRVGSFGDIGTFSFYGNKILTTGEGGMCVTSDEALYNKMQILRDHGMNRNNRYHYDVVGFNYRMTNPQAALGLAQIEEIEEILKCRDRVANWYIQRLRDHESIELREDQPGIRSVNWLYTCLADSRDHVLTILTEAGIESRPMFFPLHTMGIYKEFAAAPCSNSIGISARGLSLPTYFSMPESFVERVCIHLVGSQ